MDRIKLTVRGVSYDLTQTQQVYVLVLAEEAGSRYLPIVIGVNEAQSIFMQMERVRTPRPLTHDLFLQMARAFNVELVEVYICSLKNNIFYAELLCLNKDKQLTLDARTSDAVALALRFKCPIFTTEEVMNRAGMTLEDIAAADEKKTPSQLSAEELQEQLNEAVVTENYEQASRLRDELKKRKIT